MKKAACLLVCCMLALAAAASAQPAPQSAMPASAALLGETYNPFYRVPFDEPYTITSVDIGLNGGAIQYSLNACTDSPMEDVLAFSAAQLAGIDGFNVMQSVMQLMSGGITELDGLLPGTETAVRVRVTDTAATGETAAGRFALDIKADLAPDAVYNALFETALSVEALAGVRQYLPLLPVEEAIVIVDLPSNTTQLMSRYTPSDIGQVQSGLMQAFTEYYSAEDDALRWNTGDFQITVSFGDVADGTLYVTECLRRTDILIGETGAAPTLESLGFADYREPSAKCTLQDDQTGLWLSLSRDEWGENSNPTERNALTLMTKINGAFVMGFYYQDTDKFSVTIESGGEQVKFDYYVGEDRGTDAFGGNNLDDARRVTAAVFETEADDAALRRPWQALQIYVEQELTTCVDELMAMDYE